MQYYLRHLKTGRKIGEPCRKNESDLKSFNTLKRAEEMGNPTEKKKRIKCVETARKYIKNGIT